MEPEGSLPLSQQHATCPYSELDQSNPCLHPSSWRYILILSSHPRLGLPSGLFSASHCNLFDDQITVWLEAVTMLLIMHFSPFQFSTEKTKTLCPFTTSPCSTPICISSLLLYLSYNCQQWPWHTLYRLITFHLPNLTSFSAAYTISNYLSRYQAFCIIFLKFLRWGVFSPSPNPKPGGPPLDSYPRLFFQHICSLLYTSFIGR